MKKHLILLCVLAFSASLHVTAQSFKKQISAHPELSANNYLAYPTPSGKLTPAPSGYLPVYLSHYGRHGSRYLIHAQQYLRPIQTLERADSAGVLTNEGKDVLKKLHLMYAESYKRWGELTPLGAQQHQQIARRMYRRFPSVFRDSVWVRCQVYGCYPLYSVHGKRTARLIRHNPRLRIRHDASAHDMYFMNQSDKKLSHQRDSSAVKNTIDEWGKRNIDTKPLMARLFNDKEYVAKKVDAGQLASTSSVWQVLFRTQRYAIRSRYTTSLQPMSCTNYGRGAMLGGTYVMPVHHKAEVINLSHSVISCARLSLMLILVLPSLIQVQPFVSVMTRWLCHWRAYWILITMTSRFQTLTVLP